MTTENTNSAIQGYVVGQYFGFFDGVPKAHYDQIVATAPFDKCNLLILAFVHAIEKNGVYVAQFTNWRDNHFPLDPNDTDPDRVELIVKTARAKNPNIKILISLGWGANDAGNAAKTPDPFADSVRALVQNCKLDGFDIDFESMDVTAAAMLTLAQRIRAALQKVTPARPMVMTITPAQIDGLNKAVLQAFDFTMPQTYDHGGNGTTATWYEKQLGSYSRIVYGLNSEGYIGESDDPVKFANEAKKNKAAGIFAWRLDNDSVNKQTGYPTFTTGIKMWQLMHTAPAEATSSAG
jgi:GH18 family chitinase